MTMKFDFLRSKEVKNASWLIMGKVFQMLLSLLVGILTARYLGPGDYGLINYGASFVAFFSSICTLGINSVIVKEFIDKPEEQGLALGSTLFLRLVTALLSVLTIVAVVFVIDGDEPITIMVVALCSLSLIFHIFDTINYWFQSRYQSKVTAMVTLVAYAVTSAYKIILLALGKDVRWFALSTSIDYICVAVFQMLAYKKNGGQKLAFSWKKSKLILSKSYHYILAGMMVSIYGQTDKLMLKQMLDEYSVGYYSTAVSICNMWVFVLAAIIDSLYPTIIRFHSEQNKAAFDKKNKQLYAIVFYISAFVSLFFTIFGDWVVNILYGEAYMDATLPLKIITWYTAFSYLGTARNAWIVCENKQKYLKYIYVCAAVLNVILNLVFIPFWGTVGAAVASLLTQIFTSVVLPFFIKPLRQNAKLMIDAILLKKVF